MTVTFFVEKQTLTQAQALCPECGGVTSEDCQWCVDGFTTESISDCAELNLANANATALLYQIYPEAFLGKYPHPLEGEWSVELLPTIIWNILKVINTRHANDLVTDTVEYPQQPGRATLIMCGRSKEQVARYYKTLLSVVKDAQRLNSRVIWG